MGGDQSFEVLKRGSLHQVVTEVVPVAVWTKRFLCCSVFEWGTWTGLEFRVCSSIMFFTVRSSNRVGLICLLFAGRSFKNWSIGMATAVTHRFVFVGTFCWLFVSEICLLDPNLYWPSEEDLLSCCLTSTEARWPIRDGDRVGRGRESDRLDRGNRPKKTGETVDRRQNNGSVKAVSPRHCPATCAPCNCSFNCCAGQSH